jgi:hypothetical protein
MSNTVVPLTDVLARNVQGETVLLNMKTEHYFGLRGVAARTWQLISSGKTLDEVRVILTAEYDVSPDTLTKDLDRFVNDLASAGLVAQTQG